MPEGPEIRRSADRLSAALGGRTAARVRFGLPQLKQYERELSGRVVDSVTSRGKAMLIRFRGGMTMYSHNQLYGRWYVRPPESRPATGRQLRAAIHTRHASAYLYSASDIEVLDDDGLAGHRYLSGLGPDLLNGRTGVATVRRRLDDAAFNNRGLAALLLDQRFLAGVGNYLRSEILFVASLAPTRRPRDLDRLEAVLLANAALDTTRRAYQTGGITNDPTLVRRLRADGVPRRRYRHYVFARDGEPCYRCGVSVVRQTLAGRRLYWCTGCQQ